MVADCWRNLHRLTLPTGDDESQEKMVTQLSVRRKMSEMLVPRENGDAVVGEAKNVGNVGGESTTTEK